MAFTTKVSDEEQMTDSTKRTFLLIHGAWHGGWCYTRVRDRLESAGHRVFTPTLTGLGDRSHLLDEHTNLSTHIQDVVNVVLWEDLHQVVLVAHSYGSWVASGALEKISQRVSAAVFIDCYLPENGQQLIDFGRPETMTELWKAKEAGALGRPAPPASAFGVVAPIDRAWVDSKVTPHPLAASFEAIHLTGARDQVPNKVYIRAPAYHSTRFDDMWKELSRRPEWKLHQVPGGHDVMIDEPQLLTDILLDLTSRP